jgi:ankyrin repeat protein
MEGDDEYTQAMLADIKSLLASSTTPSNKKDNSKKRSKKDAKPSPFDIMPDFCRENLVNTAKLIKKKKQKLKIQRNTSTEDLFNHYAASGPPKRPTVDGKYTDEELLIKNINMPYTDSIMKINETFNITDNIQPLFDTTNAALDLTSDFTSSLPPPLPPATGFLATTKSSTNIKIDKFKLKYSRLCKAINFNKIDFNSISSRSDVWMARFMEECYDEAFADCNRTVSASKKVKRCGLDLGAMDAFPLSMQRLLSRTYSVLEVREKIIVEILLSLDKFIHIGDSLQLNNRKELMVNGCRSSLYSKFLSEEYDLAYLAIFLDNREILQNYLRFKLKDTIKMGVYCADTSPHMNYNLDSTKKKVQNKNDNLNLDLTSKIIPVNLPSSLRFVPDITLPDAPLVGCEISHLALLCMSLIPQGNLRQRSYIVEEILKDTKNLVINGLKRQGFMQGTIAPTNEQVLSYINMEDGAPLSIIPRKDPNESSNPATDHDGIRIAGTDVIIIYSILDTLMEQWRKIPIAEKSTFGSIGQTTESLKRLNNMYDKNCEKFKNLEKTIKDTKILLSNVNSKILKQEKSCNRLDRKYNDHIATNDEMDELGRLKVVILESISEKNEIESKLRSLYRRQNGIADKVDNLWIDAASSTVVETNENESTMSSFSNLPPQQSWRVDVNTLLLSAISYHEEISFNEREIERASRPVAVVDEPIIEPIIEMKDTEPDISSLMSSLQDEADSLLTVADQDAKDLGLVPTSEAVLQARLEEEKRILLEKQLEQERLENILFTVEDQNGYMINKDWEAEYKKLKQLKLEEENRLMQQKLDEEKRLLHQKQLQEELLNYSRIIKLVAKTEIENIINSSLEDISQATMLKRIDDISKSLELEKQREKIAKEKLDKEIKRIASIEIDDIVKKTLDTTVVKIVQSIEEEIAIQKEQQRIIMIEEEKNLQINNMSDEVSTQITSIIIDEMFDEENNKKLEIEFRNIVTSISTDMVDMIVEKEIVNKLSNDRLLMHNMSNNAVDKVTIIMEDELLIESCLNSEIIETYKDILITEDMTSVILDVVRDEVVKEELNKICVVEYRDVWESLDLDPETWLSDDTLSEVEYMYMLKAMDRTYFLKKKSFSIFSRILKFKHLREKDVQRLIKNCFNEIKVKYNLKQLILRSVIRLQKFIRNRKDRNCFLQQLVLLKMVTDKADNFKLKKLKIHAKDSIKYWYYWYKTEKKARDVKFALNERRFMITFYTWKHQHKLHVEERRILEITQTKSTIILQCVARCYNAKYCVFKKTCQLRIVQFMRVCFAKHRMRLELAKSRRLEEASSSWQKVKMYYIIQRKFKSWNKHLKFKLGFQKGERTVSRSEMGRIFKFWKLGSQARSGEREWGALIVQSTVRMWIIQRYVLHYFKWRRGVLKLQAHARRQIVKPRFAVAIFYYRHARTIQKVQRGYLLRSHLHERRILDLHYAAAANNYDRLNYYVKKFPELVTELDQEGNTALHNAAKTASRRTLKLLVRFGLDPNVLNLASYSALHLTIMSTAVNRDDCALYMLDVGFDEDVITPDGKTCLLLAIEYGRANIASQLLKNGLDPNQADHTGLTCLQKACSTGYYSIVNELIEHGADVTLPGYCGTVPLHDCIASGIIEIANLLFHNGAYVNVYEPYQYQTPLMWACAAGMSSFVRLYLLQGADVNAKDSYGYTAAHHAAVSGVIDTYNALREADAIFDEIDTEGNSPLHIACQHGKEEFAIMLLEGMCNPSLQNHAGNQPAHIAAQYNEIDIIQVICKYDEHIALMNFSHQTPLGIAKFYCSFEVIEYLESHYIKVEENGGRNNLGELWWDKNIDNSYVGWRTEVNGLGVRTFVNEVTGEIRHTAPKISSDMVKETAVRNELPMRKLVEKITEDNTITKHGYLQEYNQNKTEMLDLRFQIYAVDIIGAWMRRKLAYKERKQLMLEKRMKSVLGRFFKSRIPAFMRWKKSVRNTNISKIQASFKGKTFRNSFFDTGGVFDQKVDQKHRLRLRNVLWHCWRNYKFCRFANYLKIAMKQLSTFDDWAPILREAHWPRRNVAIYQEYLYPKSLNIYFYRHKLTGVCTMIKPKEIVAFDNLRRSEGLQRQKWGCTKSQLFLVIKLQALWRGKALRSQYDAIEKAMELSMHAKKNYFLNPEKDSHLYNYALTCHTFEHDMARARDLYIESLRRMEWRGPDDPFVLYSYSIFAFITHDNDYEDILMLLTRARKAEESRENINRKRRGEKENTAIKKGTYVHGKNFYLANVGFFRHAAKHQDNAQSWHNYAACRFLIYNDFIGSFDAFLNAFRWDPTNLRLKSNFDVMMEHFYGKDKEVTATVVRERMQLLAQRDAIEEQEKQDRREEYIRKTKSIALILSYVRKFKARKLLADAKRKTDNRIKLLSEK